MIGKKRKRRYTKSFSSYRCLGLRFYFLFRTVDKENSSNSESAPIKTVKLAQTASDLYFSCKIDKVSEVEIVDAVQTINYSIDNLITNILAGVEEFKLSYCKLSPSHKNRNRRNILQNLKPDFKLDIPRLQSLLIDSPSPLSDDMRDYIVDLILHDLVSSLIHKKFFKGGHFFGVGSETHQEYLESLFSKLATGGKGFLEKGFFWIISVNNFLLRRKLGSCRNSALAFYGCRSCIPDE